MEYPPKPAANDNPDQIDRDISELEQLIAAFKTRCKLLGIYVAPPKLTLVGLLVLAGLGSAHAQTYTTQPNIIGNMGYGYTTTGPNGQQWRTQPNVIGNMGYGYTTTGPNGQVCRSQPKIIGDAGYGFTTTCD